MPIQDERHTRFWGECGGQVGARWEWQGGCSDCSGGLTPGEEVKETFGENWLQTQL